MMTPQHPIDPSSRLAELDPNPLVVLDKDRRILYANPAANSLGGPHPGGRIEGLRLGEVLDCVHSQEPAGCGETPTCLYCGANRAIRKGLSGEPAAEECRITSGADGSRNSFEFCVRSLPMDWNGQSAVFCALNDISNEKRRRILENTFFHDILNTAGAVRELSGILLELSGPASGNGQAELIAMMYSGCNVLLDEIRSHRLMSAAETGQLATHPREVLMADCLNEAIAVASFSLAASSKRVTTVTEDGQTAILTDPVLLGRVLINLLKNAIEATPDGGEVRLAGRVSGQDAEFQVWNAGAIAAGVQLQIFKRSFSTKGAGRGIGTYSVRLFAEEYLKGHVSFVSNEREGTTFTVRLPAARCSVQPPI